MNIRLIGWAGSAVVIIAQWPQIHQLYVERCACCKEKREGKVLISV
jgi:hypothetical protein